MPISATGIRNKPIFRVASMPPISTMRSAAGFTLVEILVVIFIVMTVLSIGMLSFGIIGDDQQLETEAKRFAALTEVAQDEAFMQGREFGIEFMTSGYRFVEFDGLSGLWSEVPGDDTLRLRPLPDGSEFELYLEGKRILLDNDPAPFEDPEKTSGAGSDFTYTPHLLIYSSGDATPYELHFVRRQDDRRLVLRGDALGQAEFVDPDEDL